MPATANAVLTNREIIDFARKLSIMTEHSGHEYEKTTHRLLTDLATLCEEHVLSQNQYGDIIGKAADAIGGFNIDLHWLEAADISYRAFIVKQMAKSMLDAMRKMPEDMRLDAAYQEALQGLSIGQFAANFFRSEPARNSPDMAQKWTDRKFKLRKANEYGASKKMAITL